MIQQLSPEADRGRSLFAYLTPVLWKNRCHCNTCIPLGLNLLSCVYSALCCSCRVEVTLLRCPCCRGRVEISFRKPLKLSQRCVAQLLSNQVWQLQWLQAETHVSLHCRTFDMLMQWCQPLLFRLLLSAPFRRDPTTLLHQGLDGKPGPFLIHVDLLFEALIFIRGKSNTLILVRLVHNPSQERIQVSI